MIKLNNIKILNLKWWISKITIFFNINNKKYNFYYKINTNYITNKEILLVDFIMPIFFNIWYYTENNIDLNWYQISKNIIENLSKINILYNKWYNKNFILNINNLRIYENKNNLKKRNNKALFFSLWVDSFYTLYKNSIKDLIFINWFDIKNNDKELFNLVKEKINNLCIKNNYNKIIIETNLRNFTEKFCSWNYIFGSWLASIWLLINDYESYYISSWMEDNICYPWWSHINLDYLWWDWINNFIHYWNWIPRKKKIEFISKYDDIYNYLRVCWKNFNNKYNCWECEKCIRTMFDFCQINKLDQFKILPKKFDIWLLDKIEINEANYWYYMNTINSSKIDKNILDIIKGKITIYKKWKKKWEKNKNILFIDFNWVISYKNFWHSLEIKDNNTYKSINNYLFKENINIVKDWMVWKFSSSEICKYISNNLNLDYEYIYNTLVEDCKKIDLSENILNLLKKLKKHYYIVLVTDNMDCFSRYTLKYNREYFKIFDWIFNSSEHWFFKNDIYNHYLNKYNSQINLSYLIDDSIRNCESFKKIWWNTLNLKWEDDVVKWLKKLLKTTHSKWYWQI